MSNHKHTDKALPPSKSTRELSNRLQARKRAGLPFGKFSPRHFANVGRRHPDYGHTPLEHHTAKQARNHSHTL